MEQNPFAPRFEDLPDILPVFPLSGALLLPMGHLPLHIFEPRYVQMVEDALGGNRMIGMIQPREDISEAPSLFQTGCAGKIIEFTETHDGRYFIKLAGAYRFNVLEELPRTRLYRRIRPDWSVFKGDCAGFQCLDLDRARLRTLLRQYFEKQEIDCDWQAVEDAPDGRLITCLSMICPFDPMEKQTLLEAACCKTRATLFMTLLELAVRAQGLI